MMNDQLFSVIHKFAEDREIDYISAKVVGEQFGFEFENESVLVEWKQAIDLYLKTFEQEKFDKIEEMCNKKKRVRKPCWTKNIVSGVLELPK